VVKATRVFGQTATCYHPRAMAEQKGLLQHCAEASSRGTVWITLAIVFFVFGVLNSSGAYIGLGVAFLAIGLTRKTGSRSGS
jgi:hypothetical protein